LRTEDAKENRKRKRVCAESTPLRSRVAMAVWNAWRHRKVGGFISVGVPSVGTSDAVTVL